MIVQLPYIQNLEEVFELEQKFPDSETVDLAMLALSTQLTVEHLLRTNKDGTPLPKSKYSKLPVDKLENVWQQLKLINHPLVQNNLSQEANLQLINRYYMDTQWRCGDSCAVMYETMSRLFPDRFLSSSHTSAFDLKYFIFDHQVISFFSPRTRKVYLASPANAFNNVINFPNEAVHLISAEPGYFNRINMVIMGDTVKEVFTELCELEGGTWTDKPYLEMLMRMNWGLGPTKFAEKLPETW